jgi:hypothetical protein
VASKIEKFYSLRKFAATRVKYMAEFLGVPSHQASRLFKNRLSYLVETLQNTDWPNSNEPPPLISCAWAMLL